MQARGALILCRGPVPEPREPHARRPAPARGPAPTERAEVRPFEDGVRDLLRAALAATGGRIYGPGGAAKRLQMPPTSLRAKLRRYGGAIAPRAGAPDDAPPVPA